MPGGLERLTVLVSAILFSHANARAAIRESGGPATVLGFPAMHNLNAQDLLSPPRPPSGYIGGLSPHAYVSAPSDPITMRFRRDGPAPTTGQQKNSPINFYPDTPAVGALINPNMPAAYGAAAYAGGPSLRYADEEPTPGYGYAGVGGPRDMIAMVTGHAQTPMPGMSGVQGPSSPGKMQGPVPMLRQQRKGTPGVIENSLTWKPATLEVPNSAASNSSSQHMRRRHHHTSHAEHKKQHQENENAKATVHYIEDEEKESKEKEVDEPTFAEAVENGDAAAREEEEDTDPIIDYFSAEDPPEFRTDAQREKQRTKQHSIAQAMTDEVLGRGKKHQSRQKKQKTHSLSDSHYISKAEIASIVNDDGGIGDIRGEDEEEEQELSTLVGQTNPSLKLKKVKMPSYADMEGKTVAQLQHQLAGMDSQVAELEGKLSSFN
ncbi:hypothetical protein AAMO2058_000415600 [Amorphochlora amoebiformis]